MGFVGSLLETKKNSHQFTLGTSSRVLVRIWLLENKFFSLKEIPVALVKFKKGKKVSVLYIVANKLEPHLCWHQVAELHTETVIG